MSDGPRKRIRSEDRVPLRLSRHQLDLIAGYAFLSREALARLRFTEVDGTELILRCTVDYLEVLFRAIAIGARHCGDDQAHREFGVIGERIGKLLNRSDDGLRDFRFDA